MRTVSQVAGQLHEIDAAQRRDDRQQQKDEERLRNGSQ